MRFHPHVSLYKGKGYQREGRRGWRGLKNESFDSRSLVVGRTWCHGVGAEFREDRGGDIPAVDGFQEVTAK